MKELLDYREKLTTNLLEAAMKFRTECLAAQDPFAPLAEGNWNTHQVAAHTRDVHSLVYGLRARRTATEANPEFPIFDGDAHAAEHYNAGEPLPELLDGFVSNVEALVALLRSLPADAWARESSHEKLGSGFTLQTWVERDLAHIEEHLVTVRSGRNAEG
jgi:hypothetical protein